MNDTQSFQLKTLGIERIEELPDGLPEFDEFSGKLNIISGPNGSGKSSTARSIQRIIWSSENNKPVNITARAIFGEHDWLFKSRDGVEKQFIDQTESDLKTLLPATEAKDRYLLSLHDLIKSDDEDLARLMVRESNGGYDVEEAKKQLDYSESIRNKGLSEFKRVQESKNKVEEIKRDQRAHKKDENELDDLFRQIKEIQVAERKNEFLHLIENVNESERDLRKLNAKKEVFPEQMKHFREGDYERINELEKKREKLGNEQSSAEKRLENVRSEIERLNLPENGVSEQRVYELEEYAHKLNEYEKSKETLNVELKRTEEKLTQIKKSIRSTDAAQTNHIKIDDSDVELFEKLQLKAAELRDEVETLNQLASLFESSVSENSTHEPDQLERAIELLSSWPGDRKPGVNFSKTNVSIIAALILVSTVFVWFQPTWGIAGLLIVLIFLVSLSIVALREQKKQKSIITSEFGSLGFELPEGWSPEEIKRVKQDLIKRFQIANKDEILLNELKRVKSELTQKLPKWTEIELKMDSFLTDIGVSPKFESRSDKHYQTLYWFLKQLSHVVEAQTNIRSITASLEKIDSQFVDVRSHANEILKTAGFEEGENATQISSKYQTLNRRVNRWRELKKDEESLTEKLTDLKEETSQNHENINNLYNRLEVEFGDINAIYELDKQKEQYDELIREIAFAGKESELRTQELKSAELYDSEAEYLKFSLDQIESEAAHFERIIADKNQVVKRITEIETLIKRLKSQQNLEKAIADLDASKEELRGRYEENMRSVAGDAITRELANELQFNNQSEMFNRAAKLFATITAGRYQLQTGTGTDSGFYTLDSVLGEPKSLDKLSTGTRVQLLLSVRLAFIETQEKSLKLPLLADELLANSDEERASKIIDALRKISDDGRQIFYFTAQDDEVAKWKQALEQGEHHTNAHFYRLSINGRHHTSKKIQSGEIPTIPALKDVTVRPPTKGESYHDYVESLNLPKFNPLSDAVSELHLWYLSEDSSMLYQLLNAGINTYGAFRYLYDIETLPGEIDASVAESIIKKAVFAEKYVEFITKGKHRPINRTHLLESEYVSGNFIDDATELLESVSHNPEKFVAALRDGKLKRFRTDNIDELEEWLIKNAYISEEEVPGEDELRLRLQSAAIQVGISLEKADELIARFA